MQRWYCHSEANAFGARCRLFQQLFADGKSAVLGRGQATLSRLSVRSLSAATVRSRL